MRTIIDSSGCTSAPGETELVLDIPVMLPGNISLQAKLNAVDHVTKDLVEHKELHSALVSRVVRQDDALQELVKQVEELADTVRKMSAAKKAAPAPEELPEILPTKKNASDTQKAKTANSKDTQ